VTAAIASALHILGVALGLSALIGRELAMRPPLDDARRDALFRADNWNGLAAILLIGAGLWRLLDGLEKPTAWYLRDHAFMLKMTLLALTMTCEMVPMVLLIKWRVRAQKQLPIDFRRLGLIRTLNRIEIALLVAIIAAASLMAHGAWHAAPSSSPACAVEDEVAVRCLTCHASSGTQGGLAMDHDLHAALVDHPSSQWPALMRVVPGDPAASLLHQKLAGTQGLRGASMPLGQPPDPALAALVARWISAGAPACSR
jgi:uncharacterized membrane protein